MNRIEAELHERLAGTSPLENFERFLVWLEFLSSFAPRLEPSRDVPRSDIALL